ncbi:MAG: tRNA (N6-threonylcarbamoyladenosine(37)-N6)-methyltransferase TrmO [Deltaproteobacteria bacterium]|nr:tRNA (N6-threonylcarbamoyladenosine(37)-N6)-methyltransferase TrmO [Deltaproteobacteria bacterium]
MTGGGRPQYLLEPIGVVRSSLAAPGEPPPWGVPAAIEVAPQFADALVGIERSSHLYVLAFLQQADRSALSARPRRMAPAASPIGVFASRSPARPNPVSLTVCRLLRRDGLRLDVDALDLADGTPVVDLKPYNPGWDNVSCATRERRAAPDALGDRQLLACLQRALTCHLGADAATPAARAALAAACLATRHFGVDIRDPRLRAAVNRIDLTADALLGLLGATLSSQRLIAIAQSAPLRIAVACELEALLFCEQATTATALMATEPDLVWRALRSEPRALPAADGESLLDLVREGG